MTCFQLEDQGGEGTTRPGPGTWLVAEAGAGTGAGTALAHTEPSLVCRPREELSTPRASLRAFGLSPCFFSKQKNKKKKKPTKSK